MTRIIKLRILLDHEEDVFRDIEVGSSQTFQDLHNIIQEAFGFDNMQMASFYMSNDEWEKGQEITLMEMGQSEQPIPLMDSTDIRSLIDNTNQKLVYVFDFMLMWCFFIDVVSIEESLETVILPRITQSFGDAPDQYSKSPDIVFDSEIQEVEEKEEEDEDELRAMFSVVGVGDEEHSSY